MMIVAGQWLWKAVSSAAETDRQTVWRRQAVTEIYRN
jgi:hypothetical protein